MINVFQPSLGEEELVAVSEVFKSNWLAKGKKVEEFESKFAAYQGVLPTQMVSTTCATEGLFSILEILNLSPEDEVIMPSIGFVATASATFNVGAKAVFCDVDPRTLNSSVEDIKAVMTDKTKVVLINHYGGYPAEIDKIADFCKENKLILIEDAACAIGSSVNGKKVGTFGDFAVWSFDSMKILVTADGGMIYCKDEEMAKKMREHLYLGLMEGAKSGLEKSKSTKDRWWEYEISQYGRRAIMNDVTASIGLVQLSKLEDVLKRRDQVAQMYTDGLGSVPGITVIPAVKTGDVMTNYLYWIQLEKRDELARYLIKKNIYTTFRYWPLHKVTKYHHDQNVALPNSEKVTNITLNIPCHQSLSDADVEYIIASIKEFVKS